MKYLIILVVFLSFACNKDKTEENIIKVEEHPNDIYLDKDVWLSGSMADGFMQAKKNGVVWKASAKGLMYHTSGKTLFGLSAYTFNSKGFEREGFGFFDVSFFDKRFFPNENTNDIKREVRTSFGRLAGNGDVIANLPWLIVDTTVTTNYIDIISIDTIANVMEARFDVSFISAPNEKKEKMRFSEGYLKVKIKRI